MIQKSLKIFNYQILDSFFIKLIRNHFLKTKDGNKERKNNLELLRAKSTNRKSKFQQMYVCCLWLRVVYVPRVASHFRIFPLPNKKWILQIHFFYTTFTAKTTDKTENYLNTHHINYKYLIKIIKQCRKN